jgi:DedD protein
VVKVKERLTGAIILVALIVLLVPELLTGPVRSAPRAAAVEPSPEGAPLRSYTINLSDEARSRGTALPASGPEQPTPLAASAGPGTPPALTPAESPALPAPALPDSSSPRAASGARPQPITPPSPAPAAGSAATRAAASPAPAAATSGAWMVQLGSFASRANAERLARQVRGRGFQVSVSQESSGRRLYRVRVGPVQDRGAASLLADKLRATGHAGSVVPR